MKVKLAYIKLNNARTNSAVLAGVPLPAWGNISSDRLGYVNEITSIRDTTGGTPTTTGFAYDHGNNAVSDDPVMQLQGNGNLVNDGVRQYQYDALNRLVKITRVADGATIAAYVYDSLNRRIQKTISNGGLTGDLPNGTIDYHYDGRQIIEERNASTPTAWAKVYFWGQYVDELLFFAVPGESAPTTYRVLSDLLYRSVAIVTTANVVTEAYDTDAYGNTLCYSGPGTDGLWFTDDDVTTNNPINWFYRKNSGYAYPVDSRNA